MVNLNAQLFPTDSPIAQNQGAVTAFDFDAQNEAGVVSSAKIRNAAVGNAQIGTAAIGTANIGTLTFDQITGGTATLGGTLNGNGLLSIKNSGGTEIVRGDATGIRFYERGLRFGTANDTGIHFSSDFDLLRVEALSHNISLESDTKNIDLYAGEGTINITIGSTSNNGVVRFLSSSSGGTIAELHANGDLRIAGTLGTGVVF